MDIDVIRDIMFAKVKELQDTCNTDENKINKMDNPISVVQSTSILKGNLRYLCGYRDAVNDFLHTIEDYENTSKTERI